MLGDVLGGQLAHESGVSLDHDAIVVQVTDGAARAVVDVDLGVVAPADHSVAGRQLPGPVRVLRAERALLASQFARGLVEGRPGVVLARDHHRLLDADVADRGRPFGDPAITGAGRSVERLDSALA